MKLFDTHVHMDDKRYEEDREQLLASLHKMDIDLMVNIGADMKTSRASIELAEKYPWIYAAVGVHPHDAKSMTEQDLKELSKMGEHPKVMAIGEIGLDYHYDFSPRDIQKQCFIQQMKLANELQLPFIVHSREATQDTFDLIEEYKEKVGCVLHCFSQSLEMAKKYVQLGAYLSIGGPVTFNNAKSLKEVVQEISLDHLFIETDCPYLTPTPFRGKRNDPGKVYYVAKTIAEIKGISVEEVAEITRKNAMRFFGIQ